MVLDDEDVLSIELQYWLKRALIFDSTVGSRSNFYRVSEGCFSCGSNGMVLVDEVVLSIELGYWLKRAITCDPTFGSRSNVYRVSRGYFPWGSYGMATR